MGHILAYFNPRKIFTKTPSHAQNKITGRRHNCHSSEAHSERGKGRYWNFVVLRGKSQSADRREATEGRDGIKGSPGIGWEEGTKRVVVCCRKKCNPSTVKLFRIKCHVPFGVRKHEREMPPPNSHWWLRSRARHRIGEYGQQPWDSTAAWDTGLWGVDGTKGEWEPSAPTIAHDEFEGRM